MKKIVQDKGVKYLYHFTKIDNLDSILKNGLVPRAILEEQKLKAVYNDCYRYDNAENANCLSLGHPNYKMFYRLRCENDHQSWVVIVIQSEILSSKDCAFCHENAASKNVTSIPILQRKGVDAFQRMFAPMEGKPSRAELKLPDRFPTNPQAEILVFDIIEPQYIVAIATDNEEIKEMLQAKYPEFKFRHCPELFNSRQDYEHW